MPFVIKYVFLFTKLIFVYRLMTTPVGVTRHTGVSSRRYKGVETGRVWNLPDDVIGLVYQCTFFLSSIFFPYHNQIKIEKIPIGMRWSIPIPPFFLINRFSRCIRHTVFGLYRSSIFPFHSFF